MGEGRGPSAAASQLLLLSQKAQQKERQQFPSWLALALGRDGGVNRGLRMGSGFLEGEGRVAAEMVVSVGRTHRIRLLNGGRVTVFFTVLHLLSCVSSAQVCH